MTKPTHSDRERFVADLVRHAPAADAWFASRLMRYAGTYQRSYTATNLPKMYRARKVIKGLCEDMRCTVTFVEDKVTITMPDGVIVGVPSI